MPAQGYKKFNVKNPQRYFSPNVIEDNSIPDNMQFQTSISLPKKTFCQIDTIKIATHSKSRSAIISAAIAYYFDYISSPAYFEDLSKVMQASGGK